jgi:hypothetical protein
MELEYVSKEQPLIDISQLFQNNLFDNQIKEYDIIVKAFYNKDYKEDSRGNSRLLIKQNHRYFYYPKIKRSLQVLQRNQMNTVRSTNPSLYRAQIYDIGALLLFLPNQNYFGVVPIDENFQVRPLNGSHDFFNRLLQNVSLHTNQRIGDLIIPTVLESIDIQNSKVLILDADLTSIHAFLEEPKQNKLFATSKSTLDHQAMSWITQLVKISKGKISWVNSLYLRNKTLQKNPKLKYKVLEMDNSFIWFKGKDPVIKTIVFLDDLFLEHKLQVLESRLAKRRKYKRTFMRRIVDSLRVLDYTHSFFF